MKHKFQKGNKWTFKKGHKINIGKKNTLGYHHTKETKIKIGFPQSGEKNSNWKGGCSSHYKRKNAPRPIPERCEVCGILGSDTKRGLCYDHDHKTNQFRGWICTRCNTALGMVNDNVWLLSSLIKYLKQDMSNAHGSEDYERYNKTWTS